MNRRWSALWASLSVVLCSLALAAPAAAQTWPLIYPTTGTVSQQGLFGDCRDGCSRRHAGVDIGNGLNTDVYASYAGTAYVRRDPSAIGAGLYIEVVHPNGYMTRYLHLQSALVGNGQRVRKGQHIGEMGATGARSVHLHYEVRVNGVAQNINSVFAPYGRRITARTPMEFGAYLAAADVAPFANELAFIDRQYRDFLRRGVDQGGANLWIDQLWNGASGVDVIHQIYSSPEAAAKISTPVRLYYAAFDRHPDNGVRTWLGRNNLDTARSLILSSEGQSKLPTNPEAFVRKVYAFALNRAPNSNELTWWAARVRNEGRSRVLLDISESAEHRNIRYGLVGVHLGYLAMLNRVPESGVRSDWAGRINYVRGYAERDLIAMIRASSEYRNRVT